MNRLLVALLVLLFASCSEPNTEYKAKANNPEFLHRSLKEITDLIVHDIFSPPQASRIYVYSSIAAYETVILDDTTFRSLAGQLKGLDMLPSPESNVEYCFPLAATQAMLSVGKALVFSEDKMDGFYEGIMKEFRETGMPDDVYDRSIEYGNKVADHILQWSSKDNYKQSRSFPKYSIQSDPATWKPTPPAYSDAVEPHWKKIRTFVIDSAAQFKPERPTPFSIDKTSQFYKEALEVYEKGKNLTEEEKAIASFWDCNPFVMNVRGHVMFATKKISPGGHWINITRTICTGNKTGIKESAEAYALVSLSLADGFISCWDEKYRSNVVRPETYINQNIDENWIPLLQTPPFPEYTSGHSVISNSAATVMTKLFGDNYAFTDSTEVEFGMPPREFKSFMQAAEEATISRMYGGIHYMPACKNGKVQGRKIGEFLLSKLNTR
jgi:hypothetical protein